MSKLQDALARNRKLESRRFRIALAVLALVLLCGCSSLAFADPDEAPDNRGIEGIELPDARTATSDTYLLPNGERGTRIYQTPVNYRDEDGDWRPIEPELQETATGAITNGANSFDIHLPDDLNEAPLRVVFGEEWVSEMPLGIQVATADLQPNGTASYATASGVADFEYTGLSTGLKESIELAGPAAPTTYRFQIDASGGVVPTLGDEGSISFRDQDGQLVATMPAPTMVDGDEVPAPAEAVHYSLGEESEGRWILAVEADPEWLSAEDRSWPVLIDPTVTEGKPALDCLIVNDGAETSRCAPGETTLVAKAQYVSSGTDPIARSLLRFNTTTIPKTASLTSATIGLYSPKTATNVTKVDMYDVSRAWEGGVTWRFWGNDHHTHADKEWVNKGGDFGKYMPTPSSLTPAQRGGSEAGWWYFSSPDLTWLAQRWADGNVPNNGVLVKLADEAPHVCCFERRVQWESGGGTNMPFLFVQYIEPQTDTTVTSPTDGTKTAKRFLLTSTWNHSGVSGVTFQYMTSQGWKDIRRRSRGVGFVNGIPA